MAHVEYPAVLIEEARRLGVQLGSGEDYDPSDALETLGQEMQETARMNGDLARVRWGDSIDDPFAYEEFADFGGFSFKKLARGIGKGLGKVIKNPVVQALNPALAITAHTSSKALGGKGVIKGPVGRIVDAGTSVVMSKVNVANVIGKSPMAALGSKFAKQVPKVLPKPPIKAVVSAVRKTVTPHGVVSFGVTANGNVKSAMAAADRLLGDPKIGNSALVVRNTQALAALGDPAAKRGLAVLTAVGTIRAVKKAPPGKAVVPKTPVKTPVVQKTSPAKVTTLVKTTTAKKQADKVNQTWVQKILGWFGLEKKK